MVQNVDLELKKIRDEVWNLKDSPLFQFRTKNNYYPVLGEGNHKANMIFIGEAPGRNEAEKGRPFCGAAGRILDELFTSIGMERKEAYVTNIVKDRPPENRDPSPEEIKIYSPFLWRQISIIKPKIIVTLGRFSMWYVLEKLDFPEKTQTISVLHGKILKGKTDYGEVFVLPLYHPAVATYNPKSKEILLRDFQLLKQFA